MRTAVYCASDCGCRDVYRSSSDRALLRKAKAEYARLYGPRPWWWWLAAGIVALLFGVEAWLIYRVLAGWPLGVPLLSRVAG